MENKLKTAVVLIDYIYDIMHIKGKIARSAHHANQRHIIKQANEILRFARKHKLLIIHVKVGFSENYEDQPKHSPMFGRVHELEALKLSDMGTRFHPDLEVKKDDVIIIKPRISAFYATSLDAILRANKIEHLVLLGVSSTWAIESTARDAHDRDYQVTILEDACADNDEDKHQQAMQTLQSIATITTVGDISNHRL